MPVAVGVEKSRAHILGGTVCGEQFFIAAPEASIALLNQHRARLILCSADKDVVQPVAVDVRHCHHRAFGGQHLRHQSLAVEIHVVVLVVHEREGRLARHVGENAGSRNREVRSGSAVFRRQCLLDSDALVGGNTLQTANPAIRPIHRQRLHGVDLSESKRQDVIAARLEPPRRGQLLVQAVLPCVHGDLGAEAKSIAAFTL